MAIRVLFFTCPSLLCGGQFLLLVDKLHTSLVLHLSQHCYLLSSDYDDEKMTKQVVYKNVVMISNKSVVMFKLLLLCQQ